VIYRGKVIDVSDPKNMGRIKVEISEFEPPHNITPWTWPCSPFAGPGFGLFCLPEIGDECFVAQDSLGVWICIGYFWTMRNQIPSEGSSTARLFESQSGHRLIFDESGDVTVSNQSGSSVVLKVNGDIELNGSSGKVVTTDSICAFTGSPHPQGCSSVKAG